MKSTDLKNKKETKLIWLTAILTFICVFAWNIIVNIVVQIYQVKKLGSMEAGKAFMDKLASTNLPYQLLLILGSEFIFLLIVYSLTKKYNDGEFNFALIGLKAKEGNAKKLLLLGMGIASLMAIGLYGGLIAIGYAKVLDIGYVNCSALNILVSVMVAFVVAAVVGFAEEVVFRGVILKYLLNRRGKVFALVASSLIFTIGHVDRLSLNYLLQVFLLSIVLGYLYIITESLYLSIGVHIAWDFYSFLILEDGKGTYAIKGVLNLHIPNPNDTTFNISLIFMLLIVLIIAFMVNKRKTI